MIVVLFHMKYRKKKYSESFKPSKAENNKDVNLARVDMEMFPVEVEENIRGSQVCSHCSYYIIRAYVHTVYVHTCINA